MTETPRAVDQLEGVYVYKKKSPLTIKVHKWVGWIALQSLGHSLVDAKHHDTFTLTESQYASMVIGVVSAKRYKHYTCLANIIAAVRADNINTFTLIW